ncbi:hypothetical protein PN462_01230 [Spirulina sp. CS-785/01]|uniref:hypothetical protein n=1 Tax=Spirulina sp. CS-785/01 TaxID=3021716 RepID=UPI002330D67B|nr:hypothetical protein [Spirulina sp. CS-785/01]MDB9311705.1 hypothetical protein [Spirulina sp. CS-785/01]
MEQAEITALGHSLRRIDQNLLTHNAPDEVQRIWFQGGEPYFDLFVELREEQIEWFQLTLRGHSLSWSRKCHRWQTGITNELQTDDLTFYPASKIIESDRTPDREFFHLTHHILKTRAGEPLFDRLLALFHSTPTHFC